MTTPGNKQQQVVRDILGVRWAPLDVLNVTRLCEMADGIRSRPLRKPHKKSYSCAQYLPSGSISVGLLEAEGWRRGMFGTYTKVDPRWGLEWSACEVPREVRPHPYADAPVEFRVVLPSGRCSGAIPEMGKRNYYSVFHQQLIPSVTLVQRLVQLGFHQVAVS